MRGLWLEGRTLRLRSDLPVPELPHGEALIKVRSAGVCNTDLELLRGYYPFAGIPGHEFVGDVVKAPGAEQWVGRRVVGEINAVCGSCPTCEAGRPKHCERRTVLGIVGRDGAFAEYLRLPIANLHAVPERLPDEVATFAEPTAAALEVQEQVTIGPDDHVGVVGVGKLGFLVAQTLRLTGCDVFAVGRRPERLAALSLLGIRVGGPGELPERSLDVVVECTGNPEGLALAGRAVRPRGTIVLKSTYEGAAPISMSAFVVDEITLVGSRCGPFGPALELLAAGDVDPRPLIEARYSLDLALQAFDHAGRAGAAKVLIDPQGV